MTRFVVSLALILLSYISSISQGKSIDKVKSIPLLTANQEFARLYSFYKKNAMKPDILWKKLSRLSRYETLSKKNRVLLVQLQTNLLIGAKLPVIAATYASNALTLSDNPNDPLMKPSWFALHKISKLKPIQYLLEGLALRLKLKNKNPYSFGNDWNYILGNALSDKGYDEKALMYYKRINQASRYFMPSRYQMAMIDYDKGRFKKATAGLKAILMSSTRSHSPLSIRDKNEMWDYASMALGRILYEQKKFLSSARYYRKVRKSSPLYYEALFEQSWALFMSGNAKHALGSLYGSSSPFYSEVYNPESKVLESIVYFWMCRYNDSRGSLADFTEKYSKSIESLNGFLDRSSLNEGKSYRLFENLVSGVSSESLGIPRDVLNSAASRDTMLLVRDQLATVLTEMDRIRSNGVFGSKYEIKKPLKRIEKMKKILQSTLGRQFISELRSEKEHYEKLYSQSQFLYLELLMSEKEQLLGRELHAGSKVSNVSTYDNIRGWGRNTQSWKSERKGEFWWDEIGFHIVDVEPLCVNH